MASTNQEETRVLIGLLSVTEMATILGDRASIAPRLRRNKADVVNFIHSLPTALRDDVIRAASTKQSSLLRTSISRKRQRDAEMDAVRRVRVRVDDSEDSIHHTDEESSREAIDPSSAQLSATPSFLELPTEAERHALYSAFYAASSTTRLEDRTCAVCARHQNVVEADIRDVPINDIPNRC